MHLHASSYNSTHLHASPCIPLHLHASPCIPMHRLASPCMPITPSGCVTFCPPLDAYAILISVYMRLHPVLTHSNLLCAPRSLPPYLPRRLTTFLPLPYPPISASPPDRFVITPRASAAHYFNFASDVGCGWLRSISRRYSVPGFGQALGCMYNERVLIEWLLWRGATVAALPDQRVHLSWVRTLPYPPLHTMCT